MKNLIYIAALSTSLIVAGCQQTATNGNQTNAGNQTGSAKKPETAATSNIPNPNVPRISIQEAKAAVDAGKAVIVDVRGTSAYQQKRIKDSLDMNDIGANFDKLPKNKKIITACT